MVTLMRPEHIAEIERRVAELSSNPGKVEWRDDPDPFGRNWDWVNTDVGARDDGAPPESVTL